MYKDGMNAHRYPSDYTLEEKTVRKGERMPMRLAPGGGWVAKLVKE
ncbi:MAG: glycoside hydrolase family 97 C-terminal domain-containing protein [Saprospiraceae bacterium]